MKNGAIKLLILLVPLLLFGQTTEKKVINHQGQTWVSLNTLTKYNAHWGVIADVHERWNGFFDTNNFYFLRGAMSYLPNSKISFAAGYGHMWLAPTNPDWSTYADENRIYQQFQINTQSGQVSIIQRLRNEQRWQEKIADDKVNGTRFTNRIRYLVSFVIPVSENKKTPKLVLSDEILVHFGKEVIYNTFEQNRFFVGIKQSLNANWSYDFGYMNVYQQKYSGYQYDMNHTLRLFFYFNTSINHQGPATRLQSGDE